MSLGYTIVWPLRQDIFWIKDYIPDIFFCLEDDNFPGKEYYGKDLIIVSPQFAYLGLKNSHLWGTEYKHIMSSKYDILNLNWNDWNEGFKFNRNIDKEKKLYYDVLGLKDDSEYVFWNNMASVDVKRSNVLDQLTFDYPVVKLEYIDGFTLFDWCLVFENATEIHTVHTGINYLLDKLNLKSKKYYMYQGLHASEVQYIPFVKKPKFIPN